MTQIQNTTEVRNSVRVTSELTPGHSSTNSASPTPGEQLRESLQRLVSAAVGRVTDFALDKVDGVARSLESVAADGGPKIGAVLGGVQAKLSGGNLVWGAMKGAFGTLSTGAKVGILLLLVLAVVLLPVSLVLLLLGLIVLVVVLIASSRSAG